MVIPRISQVILDTVFKYKNKIRDLYMIRFSVFFFVINILIKKRVGNQKRSQSKNHSRRMEHRIDRIYWGCPIRNKDYKNLYDEYVLM